MAFQEILTIPLPRILETLMDLKTNNRRIISLCPHYAHTHTVRLDGVYVQDQPVLIGYIIVVE